MAVLTAAIVLTAAVSCISYVPESSADYEAPEFQYGNTFGMDLAAVDAFIDSISGGTYHSLSDLVKGYLEDNYPSYKDINVVTESKTEFALTRNTTEDGDDLYIRDHLVGYFTINLYVSGIGPFPNPGKYYAAEYETGPELIKRVFNGSANPDTHREFYISLKLYTDVTADMHYDMSTGELVSTEADGRFMVLDDERRNIIIDPITDGNGKVEAIDVDYSQVTTENDIYLDIGMDMGAEGMKIFSDEESWHIDPITDVTLVRARVSSDLADSVGKIMLESMEENNENAALPELVLKLLRGGGRNMDLVETIKSLTSSELPVMRFLEHFDAQPYTDSHGYEYTKLTEPDSVNYITLSKGAYVLNMCDLVAFIPDSILGPLEKIAIDAAFIIAGWNEIDIMDLSGDDGTVRNACNALDMEVNEILAQDEGENYDYPTAYKVIAGIGIAIAVLIPLLVWRRII